MKLCIEIPDDVATSGWVRDAIDEGIETCWCSDDTTGVPEVSAFLYALADILDEGLPVEKQQAFLDAAMKEEDVE